MASMAMAKSIPSTMFETVARVPGPLAVTDTVPRTLVSTATANGHRRR
jgi:hypothetical protein